MKLITTRGDRNEKNEIFNVIDSMDIFTASNIRISE